MKIEALASREHRRGNLMQLRRREDEKHMLGRLLESFQQCVESRDREHMHLIDDIDTIFQLSRRIDHGIADIADIVNAVVACRVHFDNIGAVAAVYTAAGGTLTARIAVHGRKAVCRFCYYLGTGGFSRASRTAKKICMRYLACLHFAFQHRGDMILPYDILKYRRAPFSVERLIHFPPLPKIKARYKIRPYTENSK